MNEIARLRYLGLIDYHAVAALERVQAILKSLQDQAWIYVPKMIKRYFYVAHPDKYTRAVKSALEHFTGYDAALSMVQAELADRMIISTMGTIAEATSKVFESASDYVLGPRARDVISETVQEALVSRETGAGFDIANKLKSKGITAFVDKAGREWSLHAYADMVLRTAARQADTMAVLTKDPEHDLYKISSHGTTCPLCAPYEGRVYSKSGTDPIYPPLASAFGKIDPMGPNELRNTWLNIHPNCLHVIVPWTPAGRSAEEIKKIQDFSNPKTNPFDRDPRSEEEIKAYRDKERARQKLLADIKQYERYVEAIPGDMPKTFATFLKHKRANSDKYRAWVKAYRDRAD